MDKLPDLPNLPDLETYEVSPGYEILQDGSYRRYQTKNHLGQIYKNRWNLMDRIHYLASRFFIYYKLQELAFPTFFVYAKLYSELTKLSKIHVIPNFLPMKEYVMYILLGKPSWLEVVSIFGLESFQGHIYDVLSILNLVPLTSWNPEVCRQYLNQYPLATYPELLAAVLGRADPYYLDEQQLATQYPQAYQQILGMDPFQVSLYYIFLVLYRSPTYPQVINYQPGHLLGQLVPQMKKDNSCFRLLNYIYSQPIQEADRRAHIFNLLGYPPYQKSDLQDLRLITALRETPIQRANSAYHLTFNQATYRALVICYEQYKFNPYNSQTGVAPDTLKNMNCLGFDLSQVYFDAIALNFMRVAGQIYPLDDQNKFPSRLSLETLIQAGVQYDYIVFEYCPKFNQLATPETLRVLYQVLAPQGFLALSLSSERATNRKVKYFKPEDLYLLRSYFMELETNCPYGHKNGLIFGKPLD